MLANNAWMISRMMATTFSATLPSWMLNIYRYNCLQPGALTAQLNYYRFMLAHAPEPDPADVLGPKKDGDPTEKSRLLDLPILMIRGKEDEALPEGVFVGYDRYLSNARLVALDKCSHWIQKDCPTEVNQELENFLAKLEK